MKLIFINYVILLGLLVGSYKLWQAQTEFDVVTALAIKQLNLAIESRCTQ